MVQMILLLFFMHFLKNDIEFVDDFPNCKEVFYFEFFIQDQFSFASAFDGITFLKRLVIIYIVTVVKHLFYQFRISYRNHETFGLKVITFM